MIILLREYREKKNLTLKRLSILSGINDAYLSRIENGKQLPSLNVIERVGHALNICPIMLLGGCSIGFCTDNCVYYKDKYKEFSLLPIEGQLEVMKFIRYIKKKYKLS